MATRSFSQSLRIAQRVIGFAAITAIVFLLLRHRDQVAQLFNLAGIGWFACGGLLFVCSHPLVAGGFHFVHRAMGIASPWKPSLDSYLRRLPARYVPGGIWHSLARYLDLRSAGLAETRTLFRVFAIENGVIALTGLGVAAITTTWFSAMDPTFVMLRLPLAAATLALAIGLFALKLWTQQPIEWRALSIALLLHAINWLWLPLAFSVYARGLDDRGFIGCQPIDIALHYLMATVSGFIAFFAPQGWGVAEYIFASLRPCGASVAVAVAALTGFRIVCLFADTALFACWYAYRRLRKTR